jgi:DNA-binding CsgD family transcriptional regulator
MMICGATLLFGIVAAGVISSRYLSPLMSALGAIRSGRLDGVKTNIKELDHIIEELRSLRAKDMPLPDDFFAEVIRRISAMTPVEKKVFHSFIQGDADRDTMRALFLTKQALNTHIARICEKLGVPGREALLLYVEIIKMSGQTAKLTD